MTLTVGCRGVRRTRGSSASILEKSRKLLALEASWNALVDLGMSRAFESKYASVVLFLHCPHSLFHSDLIAFAQHSFQVQAFMHWTAILYAFSR
jgi:hypothetical protein